MQYTRLEFYAMKRGIRFESWPYWLAVAGVVAAYLVFGWLLIGGQ